MPDSPADATGRAPEARIEPPSAHVRPLAWPSIAVAFAVLGLAIALLIGLAGNSKPSGPAPRPTLHSQAPAAPAFLRGVYGSKVIQPGSLPPRIDVEATVAALSAANVNTYAYLICPDATGNPAVSSSQWHDLPALAKRAGQAGIDIYVYLVPPTEAPQAAYLPFGWNYLGWAEGIGRMAVAYPAIKGIMIDDFGQNTIPRPSTGFVFTPEYVRQMMAAARAQAPHLALMPVLYYSDLTGPVAVINQFRAVISGVVFPYFSSERAHLQPGNTVDASQALAQGRDVAELLSCPDPNGCTVVTFPSAQQGQTAPSASVSAVLSPQQGARQSLTIDVKDGRGLGEVSPSGRLEVLLDGQVSRSWTPSPARTRQTVDLTSAVAGRRTVEVALRVSRPTPLLRGTSSITMNSLTVAGFATSPQLTLAGLRGDAGTTVAPLVDLPLVYMTYAAPLSAERGAGASPQYVAAVLGAVQALRAEHQVQGSLVFNPRLPGSHAAGDPRNYHVVAEVYRRRELQ